MRRNQYTIIQSIVQSCLNSWATSKSVENKKYAQVSIIMTGYNFSKNTRFARASVRPSVCPSASCKVLTRKYKGTKNKTCVNVASARRSKTIVKIARMAALGVATESSCFPLPQQQYGTVCHQKWRLQSACEHVRLNLRLTKLSRFFSRLTAKSDSGATGIFHSKLHWILFYVFFHLYWHGEFFVRFIDCWSVESCKGVLTVSIGLLNCKWLNDS